MQTINHANPPYHFNPTHLDPKAPFSTRELTDLHPAIRGTNWEEVSKLLDTGGCGRVAPNWSYMYLGMVSTEHGKLIISPDEWLLEPFPGVFLILTNEQFETALAENTK